MAKNIVAAFLATKCQIQVDYAIGVAHPMNITVNTVGTGVNAEENIAELVYEQFGLRPKGPHSNAGPVAPNLQQDRSLWPLWL